MSAPLKTGTKKGIHLVTGTAKAQNHPNTRLTLGEYIADVLISKNTALSFHYIVQRIGSAEIIDMQAFNSFDEAERAAKESLQEWHMRDHKQAG
jgi:hypothetical protein